MHFLRTINHKKRQIMFFTNCISSKLSAVIKVLVFKLFLVLSLGSAFALDCPMPQSGSPSGTIKESSEDIKNLAKRLAENNQENVIKEVALELKKKYPASTSEDIVNYLVTAYCPVVKQKSGLSEPEMAQEIEAFSSRVLRTISQPG